MCLLCSSAASSPATHPLPSSPHVPASTLSISSLARNPLLREVAMVIGNGLSLEVAAFRIYMRSRALGLPYSATDYGISTLREVWIAGSDAECGIFFHRNGMEFVDSTLLAEVRRQQLVTCSACSAFVETGSSCLLCVLRADLVERMQLMS